MNKKMTTIPTGALLYMTEGCYSDYGVMGVFKALKDIDADALLAQWLELHPEQREGYSFDNDLFLGWVTGQGYLEQVYSYEWHLTDYSNSNEMLVTGPV